MGYDSPGLEWAEIIIREKDRFIAAHAEFEQIWSRAKCKWFFKGLRQSILWDKITKKYELAMYVDCYRSNN